MSAGSRFADHPALRIGMGGADLGNLHAAISDERAADVLRAAWDGGVRYFDTAPHYGLGLSERRLGAFLADRPRDDVLVSTKVGRRLRPRPGGPTGTGGPASTGGPGSSDDTADTVGTDLAAGFDVPATHERVWDVTPDGVRRCLDESLHRLGLDRVDLALLHDPDESPDPTGALTDGLDALVGLRERGVVRAIGVGSKSVPTLRAAAVDGRCDVLMVAGRLTLLEWADDLIAACAASGTAVLVAGAFNSGLLATPDPGPDARYEYGAAPPERLAAARELAARCAAAGTDLPTAALHHPLRRGAPIVRGVVLGGTHPDQVRQNLARLATPPPERVWDRLAGVRVP